MSNENLSYTEQELTSIVINAVKDNKTLRKMREEGKTNEHELYITTQNDEIDVEPLKDSDNLVFSSGVYNAIEKAKEEIAEVTEALSEDKANLADTVTLKGKGGGAEVDFSNGLVPEAEGPQYTITFTEEEVAEYEDLKVNGNITGIKIIGEKIQLVANEHSEDAAARIIIQEETKQDKDGLETGYHLKFRFPEELREDINAAKDHFYVNVTKYTEETNSIKVDEEINVGNIKAAHDANSLVILKDLYTLRGTMKLVPLTYIDPNLAIFSFVDNDINYIYKCTTENGVTWSYTVLPLAKRDESLFDYGRISQKNILEWAFSVSSSGTFVADVTDNCVPYQADWFGQLIIDKIENTTSPKRSLFLYNNTDVYYAIASGSNTPEGINWIHISDSSKVLTLDGKNTMRGAVVVASEGEADTSNTKLINEGGKTSLKNESREDNTSYGQLTITKNNALVFTKAKGEAVKDYAVYHEGNPPVRIVEIILDKEAWEDGKQEVDVEGILANEMAQIITPTPALSSQEVYYNKGVRAIGQAEGVLTFKCNVTPDEDLAVHVIIQEVLYDS